MGLGSPPPLNSQIPVFSNLYNPKDRIPNVPVLDSAVEIEIDTNHVIGTLTTPDGTVGGFLGARPMPKWLEKSAANPRKIPWDNLSAAKKLRLLQHGARLKETSFYEDRSIEGICVKSIVTLSFKKETDFLGKTYPPGAHDVNVSNILGKVEYRTPSEVLTVAGLELHFREGGASASAGTVSQDAWTFLDGLGAPRTHQHVHIVAPMPFAALERDPMGQSLRMTDFIRRANATAEMISILWHGQSITVVSEGDTDYFSFLKSDDLKNIFRYLWSVVYGEPDESRPELAWINFRRLKKYDDPNLWGMENRWLNADAPSAIAREFLDTVQMAMLNDKYGVPEERLKRWFEWCVTNAYGNIFFDDALEKAWFHKAKWETVLRQIPAHVRKFWEETGGAWATLRARLQGVPTFHEKLGLFRENDASLDLLFHDWSFDPLLFDNPKKLSLIANEQLRALNRILAGEDMRPAIQDFLKKTGLFTLFASSLGGKKSSHRRPKAEPPPPPIQKKPSRARVIRQ